MNANYQMVDECVNLFQVKEMPGNGAEIVIKVPERFVDLWIVKLNSLKTTDQEISEYERKSE